MWYTVKNMREHILTKREAQVLSLISKGIPTAEVAKMLLVSKRTIDFHLNSIYQTLGVSNRMQAFRAAMDAGIINANGDVIVSFGQATWRDSNK